MSFKAGPGPESTTVALQAFTSAFKDLFKQYEIRDCLLFVYKPGPTPESDGMASVCIRGEKQHVVEMAEALLDAVRRDEEGVLP